MKKLISFILVALSAAVGLCVLINLFVVLSTAGRIVSTAEAADFGADHILVLGASVIDNAVPSDMLEDRITAAVDLYKACGVPLLMSGDHRDDNYNEVKVMQARAEELGVPEADIVLDHSGISTYDSVVRAKSQFGAQRIVVVTQRYHLYRALFIARANGLDAVGVAADARAYGDALSNNVREFFARIKDFFSVLAGAESSDFDF